MPQPKQIHNVYVNKKPHRVLQKRTLNREAKKVKKEAEQEQKTKRQIPKFRTLHPRPIKSDIPKPNQYQYKRLLRDANKQDRERVCVCVWGKGETQQKV